MLLSSTRVHGTIRTCRAWCVQGCKRLMIATWATNHFLLGFEGIHAWYYKFGPKPLTEKDIDSGNLIRIAFSQTIRIYTPTHKISTTTTIKQNRNIPTII